MPLSPARMLRAGATLLTAGAVALAGLTPAQAAEDAAEASPRLSFTCSTGKGTRTFTATFDSDAPVQMRVGDPAVPVKLSTTLTLPNSGYVSSYWWAAKRKVSGPVEFNATIGDAPVRSTLSLAHTPADAWFGEGASWTIGGEGALGTLTPTTAGDVAVKVGGFSGTLTWTDGYNNLPVRDTVSCTPVAGQDNTVDTVRVVSGSHTEVETPVAEVEQGSGAKVTALVGVDGGTVAGTVRFRAGTASVDVPVDSTGRVTGTLPVLPPGAYEVTAQFLPTDTVHYESSTSRAVPLSVRAATGTSVALTAPATALTTDTVQLRAVVSADGSTQAPAGQVEFLVDNRVVATSQMSQTGVATALVSDLAVGARVVQARFVSSNTNRYLSSSSSDRTITVSAPAVVTETLLTVQPDTVKPTERATVTAQVFAGGATASGTVDFVVENDEGFFETHTATLAGGQASLQLPPLALGTYSVTASFTPQDAGAFTASSSATRTLTVKTFPATSTSTSVTLSPSTIHPGEVVEATVQVTQGSGSVVPSGTVRVTVDGREVVDTLVNGRVTLELPSVTRVDQHTVVAYFTPAVAADFLASQSTGRTLTVVRRPAVATQSDLSLSRSSVTVGDAVTATATVTPADAEGRFEFTVDGAVVRARADQGTAEVALPELAVGQYDVQARFVPDDAAEHVASTSDVRQLTVLARPAAATTTVLSLSRNAVSTAQSVVATAEVTSDYGRPSGTVTFTAGSVSVTAPVLGGRAQVDLGALPVGQWTVRASYEPQHAAAFVASVATPLTLTVTQAPADATVTTLTLLSNPVVAGQQAEASIEVASAGGTAHGTATLSVDGRTVRGIAVVDGLATATLPEVTTPGSYPVTVTFAPAAGSNLRASQDSRTLTVVTGPANVASTTAVQLSRGAVEQGQPVTATATVVVPGLPAAGQVQFRAVSGTEVRTATAAVSGGEATVALTGLGVGTWSVTGTFQPSRSGVAASTSHAVPLVVSQPTAQVTSTELELSSGTAARGESVRATATVRGASGAAQGTVTFTVADASVSATVVDGRAEATLPVVAPGVHRVVATFVPASAATTRGSVSAPAGLTVQDTTALVLSLSAVSTAADRPVTASATVSGSGGVPTGTVVFSVGGRETTSPLVGGRATATLPTLAPGQYAVRAEYLPVQATVRGSSGQQALRVTEPADPPVTPPQATSLNLSTSAATTPYGRRVEAVAQVPAGAEGIVTFATGGTALEVKVVGGRAVAQLPVVGVGRHAVTATYLPADPQRRRPATASTTLTVVKDTVRITFGKRWAHSDRQLTHTTRVRPRNGSAAQGRTVVVLQKKVGKKYRNLSRHVGQLGGNGYVRFTQRLRPPVTGTYRVRVTYAGSDTLQAATFTKSFRIG